MNARQKREQKRAEVQKWVREQDPDLPEAVPSSYGFSQLPPDVKKVVFFDRVSHHSQVLHEHLQIKGVKIAHSFTATETGKGADPQKRPVFYRAVKKAKELNLPILATCFSRYLRSNDYNIVFGRDSQPSIEELELFLETTGRAILYTLNDPDVTPEEDRMFLLALSKQQRVLQRRKIGSTKKRKLHNFEVVLKLRKEGLSYRQIAKVLREKHKIKLDYRTIYGWLN